jgi:valyl-tRNA synthetase
VLQMLSPMVPHLTEEIYQAMYADEKGYPSLQLSPWPTFNSAMVDELSEKRGDLIIELIGEVRREKAQKHLPLNNPIKKLIVYARDQSGAEAVLEGESDIIGACKVECLLVLPEEGTGVEVTQFPGVHFVAEHGEVVKK